MPKRASRAIVKDSESDLENFVAWWATAMWIAAAVYHLATFAPY